METVSTLGEWYAHFVWHYGDPRTKDWVGVRTPWLTVGTMVIYLLVISKVLPWYMKNKQPFKLRSLLIVYNCVLSIFSLATFLKLGFAGWFWNVNYQCFPTDYSVSPDRKIMLDLIWYFWVSKFVELLDTVFFVLRKKDRQVTVLHVYHHCSMIFNVWITIKTCAVGHFTFVGLTNSFVHFPMYAYYGLSAIGPHMQKYLSWKKYITKIQLIQFVLNIIHATQVLFNKCNVSTELLIISSIQSFIFLMLFLNFYVKAYTGQPSLQSKNNISAQSKKEDENESKFSESSHANGELKTYCQWSSVNGLEKSAILNGNSSYRLRSSGNLPESKISEAQAEANGVTTNGTIKKRVL